MKIGIVGLPNAGKSTLFNALTAAGAETGAYPFTTIDPNVAIVEVPDPRLDQLAELLRASKVTPATVEFHDIAGLVQGAAQGEGLGNRFLGAIRETDAICHVVRVHNSDDVTHPEGRIDPVADIDLIDTELLAADLEQAERRLERVTKQARSGDEEAVAERDWLEEVVSGLEAGRPVRDFPPPETAPDSAMRLSALTSKPVLYVANVEEGEVEVPGEILERARTSGAQVVAISARIEAELRDLDRSDAEAMRQDLGIERSGLETLILAAFDLLDLLVFFTAGVETEAVARTLPRGGTAWDAAGKIHTDIQQGFVRAEVVSWSDLVEYGGYAEVRDAGLLRTEGRDYAVQDGDVITIRH